MVAKGGFRVIGAEGEGREKSRVKEHLCPQEVENLCNVSAWEGGYGCLVLVNIRNRMCTTTVTIHRIIETSRLEKIIESNPKHNTGNSTNYYSNCGEQNLMKNQISADVSSTTVKFELFLPQ